MVNNKTMSCTKEILNTYDMLYIKDKYNNIKSLDTPYALLYINIKNFRYYIAKHGSVAADEIITIIYQVLSSFLNEQEYISCVSSDTFVALLQYENIDALVYERVMDILDKAYRTQDEKISRNIFLSIGIYRIVDPQIYFYDALNYANICRKESSGIHKRCHSIEVFDDVLYHQYMDRLELEVKTADAYKNYEFIAYLQPKVNLKTGKISGSEALIRWIDKDGQLVPLYKYLPILNENSYIVIVDLDIFDQLCNYLDERIKRKEKVLPISFNFSKASFYSDNIQKKYTDIFEKYTIPKSLIEIEFMETISLDDTERMKKIVSGFKNYGFQCSLDDFGNGYSSFNVLLNAQFDVVKMDRQFFIENLRGDNKLVIKTVIDLIHSLHIEVVAEGVETKEHIDFLKECGCDNVQGYYYFKPMPIEEFNQVIEEENNNEKI